LAKKEQKKDVNPAPAHRGRIKIFCDMRKCVACKTCELACAAEHSKSKDILLAVSEEPLPKKRRKVSGIDDKVISFGCQHCEDAPCVTACMSGAMYKDPATGETKHNKDKCVGCWMCMMVCPFNAIVRDVTDKVAVKCDLCPDRDDYACVVACPTNALFAGTPEEFKKKLEEKGKTKSKTKAKSGV